MRKLLFIYILLFCAFFIYMFGSQLKKNSLIVLGDDEVHGERQEKFVMVTFQAGIDYWRSALKGFEDAAEDLNVSVEYRGATQYDVKEQINVLEQVIAKYPAGIAISAIDPHALNKTIDKAVKNGIPVVIFDADAPDSNAVTFLGTDNYESGVTAAHKMAELLHKKGKVAVVTLLQQLNHQERTKGFVDTVIKEYPLMEIVGIKNGKGDQLISKQSTLEVMREHQDLDGIFMTEGNGGVGAGEAVRESNNDELKIISFDTDKETLDMVKDGTITATMAQGTWKMGYWSLHYIYQQNKMKSSIEYEGADISLLMPSYVDTGITVVTKKNVGEYYAK